MDSIFEVDHLPPQAGKYAAKSYQEIGGGIAANGAVTVSRLGGRGILWSRIGDDDLGQRIRRELQDFAVNTKQLQIVKNCASALSCVLIDHQGERLLVNHCDARLFADADDLPLQCIADAAALLVDLRWPCAAEKVLRAARQHAIPAVLDYDQLTGSNAEVLLSLASHVVFGKEALQQLSGKTEAGAGLRYARNHTHHVVAVTLGGDGVLWLDENNREQHLPAFRVEVVDTLAAGDVFHGALALALAEGRDFRSGLRFASAAAALKCTRFGGRLGIPSRAEVGAFLQQNLAAATG